MNEQFDYHDKIIFEAYTKGFSIPETVGLLSESDPKNLCGSFFDKSISELKSRESSIDIKSSEYIDNYCRESRLFWTFNHPSNDVLFHVAAQLFELLGISNDIKSQGVPELLDGTIYPILPRTRSVAQIGFDSEMRYRVRKVEYTPEVVVGNYFDFYDKNPTLVELNGKIVS